MSTKGKHWKLSKETKEKLSISKIKFLSKHPERKKKFYDWTGKRHKPETIEKMISSNRHTSPSKEQREKIRMAHIGTKASDETKRKMGVSRTGKGNPNWKGGLSFEVYPAEFNGKLKELIKNRDIYFCQLCGEDPKTGLSIHHIDYNKSNSKQDNLIALCRSCHSKVTAKREFWKKYFQDLISFKKIMIEIFDTRAKKSIDYGQSWKIGGLEGIANQMKNKMLRIWNIESKGIAPKNESLRDSYKDLAVYSLMGFDLLMREDIKPDNKELSKLILSRFHKINKGIK